MPLNWSSLLNSLFADFATVFAYGIVFYFDMEHFHLLQYVTCPHYGNTWLHITSLSLSLSLSFSFHIRNYSLEGLPFFLGVSIYCYEGAGLILSLEGSVNKDLRGSFKSIFLVAMVVVTSLYVGFGVCGYLSFGPETESIITLNLPSGESWIFITSIIQWWPTVHSIHVHVYTI